MKRQRFWRWLGVLTVTAFAAPEVFGDEAVPEQVWFMKYSKWQRKSRMTRFGLPYRVDGTSRLEAELQANVDLERLADVEAQMDALVADPAKAEALFGQGFRLVRALKEPRDVWDSYLDTPDGLLAATNASMRNRSENGVDKINFKGPSAVRFEDGVVYRVESGASVLPTSNVAGFLRSRLRDNPTRELPRYYPRRDVAEFLTPAVEIKQKRAIYEVHHLAADGSPSKVAEMTVDRVRARLPGREDTAVEFGRFELEGDHITLVPTPEQAARLANTKWKGPHRVSDTRNPALVESHEVKEVHRLSRALSRHLNIRPAGMSKYAEGRQRLGMRAPTARVR